MLINKNMFLLLAISVIIGTTSTFQFSTVNAQSNNTSSFVNTTAVESPTVVVKNFAFDFQYRCVNFCNLTALTGFGIEL